jgi:hypothetical protein
MPIFARSLEERVEIFRWIEEHGKDGEDPVSVLIGGWAVYVYNSWYGSVDIDIVTNSRTKQSLMKHLREKRGYIPKREPMLPNTVVKSTPDGLIEIDFATREEVYRFEGRDDTHDFHLLDRHTYRTEIHPGCRVVIPTRALLLFFKLKVAWDRLFRLESRRSVRPEWDRAKLGKDYADILALLDPALGFEDLDRVLLGDLVSRYPFLVIRSIPRQTEGIRMYGRMTNDEVKEIIDRLLQLIT